MCWQWCLKALISGSEISHEIFFINNSLSFFSCKASYGSHLLSTKDMVGKFLIVHIVKNIYTKNKIGLLKLSFNKRTFVTKKLKISHTTSSSYFFLRQGRNI